MQTLKQITKDYKENWIGEFSEPFPQVVNGEILFGKSKLATIAKAEGMLEHEGLREYCKITGKTAKVIGYVLSRENEYTGARYIKISFERN